MRTKTFLGVALLVLCSATLLLAQPERARDRIREQLKLSDKQQAELKELNFNTAKELIRMRADMKVARLELRQMLSKDEPDREAIFGKLDQIARILTDIRKARIEKMLAVREILDKDQLSKLKEMRRERRMHS